MINVRLDRDALMADEPTKIALALAVREALDPKNPQPLRDEWNRAQWRHLFDFIFPGDSSDIH